MPDASSKPILAAQQPSALPRDVRSDVVAGRGDVGEHRRCCRGARKVVQERIHEPEEVAVIRLKVLIDKRESAGEQWCRRTRAADRHPRTGAMGIDAIWRGRAVDRVARKDVREHRDIGHCAAVGIGASLLVIRAVEQAALAAAAGGAGLIGRVVPDDLRHDLVGSAQHEIGPADPGHPERRGWVIDGQHRRRRAVAGRAVGRSLIAARGQERDRRWRRRSRASPPLRTRRRGAAL